MAALTVPVALAAPALAAVTIYQNDFAGPARMQEFRKAAPGSCSRSNADGTMSVRIGRNNQACTYRAPVFGKNMDLAASAVIDRKTPAKLRGSVAWALAVRSGERSDYSLTIYPAKGRWVLTRAAPGSDGQVGRAMLQQGRESFIHGVGAKNRLELQAFAGEVVALVNNRPVARYTDPEPDGLNGRQATLSIVSDKPATGAIARFDSVTIQIPSP